MEVKNII